VIPGEIACERCDFLDATSTEGAAILVVEALRDHRWLTTDDLARHCNISHRRLWRAVAWLRQRGRLVTETVETEHSNQTSGYDNSPTHAAREYHQKFRTATPATLLTMHNVYRLTDRRAA
jgi:transcription initiation factor IIE alpha subunit